tara:strand:+ start:12458 stop:14776 length:2319 start_codon:yes stop_codon:yes gene_type:complete
MRVLAAALALVALLLLAWSFLGSSDPEPTVDQTQAAISPRDSNATDLEVELQAGPKASTANTRQDAEPTPASSISKGDLLGQVLDVADRPVEGMSVIIKATLTQDLSREGTYLADQTDAQGLVHFRAADLERLALKLSTSEAWIQIATQLPEPVGARIDLSNPGSEPVVLRPRLGLATVDVLNADGTLRTDRGGVMVEPEGLGYDSVAGTPPLRIWVPLDRPYQLKAYRFGVFKDVEQAFPAMTAQEPQRHHSLQLGERVAAFLGRLLEPDGQPVDEGTFFGLRNLQERYYGKYTDRIMAGGLIHTQLDRRKLTPGESVRFRITATLGELEDDHLVEFTAEIPEQDIDIEVGDLVLQPRPVLVAGQVFGPTGEPEASAHLMLRTLNEEGYWIWREYQNGRSMSSGPDGRFAFYGADPEGRTWSLDVRPQMGNTPNIVPAKRFTFEPGDENLEVQLVDGGWLQGRVVVTDGTRASQSRITVSVIPTEEPAATPFVCEATFEEAGVFRAGPLPPGVATLTVRPGWSAAPIIQQEGLAIQSGETLDVGTLSLEGQGHSIRVRITGPEPGTQVRVHYRGEGDLKLPYTVEGTVGEDVVLSVLDPPVDGWVSCKGYAPGFFERAFTEAEVHLERGLNRTLIFEGLDALCSFDLLPDAPRVYRNGERVQGVLLRLRFTPLDSPLETWRQRGAFISPFLTFQLEFPDKGRGWQPPKRHDVSFPHPGRYRVSMSLDDYVTNLEPVNPIPEGMEPVIEVTAEPDGEIVLRMPAPAEASADD